MFTIVLLAILSVLRDSFRGRAVLQLELLALRHQLATLERISPRPSLRPADRILWVILSRILPNWREVLVIGKPETVVGWHRKGFRLFWAWKSRRRGGGRPTVPREVRDLIHRMSRENPLWGAVCPENSCGFPEVVVMQSMDCRELDAPLVGEGEQVDHRVNPSPRIGVGAMGGNRRNC